jgi:hypothetical protein
MQYQLRIAGKHYTELQSHLFPGDGKEAVAVILCGRHETEDVSILLTHQVELIPHNECHRDEDFVHWKTDRLKPLLEKASKYNMAILKIHSHPGGFNQFSEIDDVSDNEIFPSVFGWCDGDSVHGSAVMLPCGRVFGRVFTPSLNTYPFDKISVAGDNISIWLTETGSTYSDDFSLRTVQTFGQGTYNKLRTMKVGVVGCSGTGSPTIEQLARMGVGELVIIDSDVVEHKNLNRIYNATRSDADAALFKTDVIKGAVDRMELNTTVYALPHNLYDSPEAIQHLITCDVVFGCMDSVDGRHLLSQLTNFYLIPYFDMGVKLKADGMGSISTIVASINYIQPGRSSLLSRRIYTPDDLAAATLHREDPEEFERLKEEKYIEGGNTDSPAVISINTTISSMAINEFLNRIHRFKAGEAYEYAQVVKDYIEGEILNLDEANFPADILSVKHAGRGFCNPLLNMPELSHYVFA